jgi:hypothetical protein
MSPIRPVPFVCLASLWLLSSLGRAAMISDSYYERQLSDHGYGNIIRFMDPQQSAVRTIHLFTTGVTSGDKCQAFYDTAFFLNNDEIEKFASGSLDLDKLAKAMRLNPSVRWSFDRDSEILKANLDHFDRTVQYVVMRTTLVHADRFAASDGAPRTFVSDRDAAGQDCFFEVQLRYFIAFDAPIVIHIFVMDTTPHCGSRLKWEETWQFEPIDRTALKSWINNLGIERDYQQFFRVSSAQAGGASAGAIDSVHRSDAYHKLLDHCHESLNKNR